jgi:hypothetical protein
VIDTSGVTIKITVSSPALQLRPGTYGPGVAFTNVSNGQGSVTKSARLVVTTTSSMSSALTSTDYLLDGQGGYVLDDDGERLLAQ